MAGPPKTIGLAVVEHDGQYLVGFRASGSTLAGFAEFPGGKCEPGETAEACACRECLEETGLEVEPVRLLFHRSHAYPHGQVDLHFWLCRPTDPRAVAEEHQGFRWVPARKLTDYRFPDANEPLVHTLATSSGHSGRDT